MPTRRVGENKTRQQMKFQQEIYLKYDPYACDEDVDIRCRTIKIVKVRKPHMCFLADLIGNPQHDIQPGSLALYEHALVDGQWGDSYTCLDCMDKWLIEEAGLDPAEEPSDTTMRHVY